MNKGHLSFLFLPKQLVNYNHWRFNQVSDVHHIYLFKQNISLIKKLFLCWSDEVNWACLHYKNLWENILL